MQVFLPITYIGAFTNRDNVFINRDMPTTSKSNRVSLIRARSLVEFSGLGTHLGSQAQPLMRACGLDPASLLNPDSALPLKNVVRLLAHAVTTRGVADFGLQLVDCHPEGSIMGPLTMSVLHAQTIWQALTTLAKSARLHNSGASLVMAEDKRQGFTQCRHDFGLERQLPSPTGHGPGLASPTLQWPGDL